MYQKAQKVQLTLSPPTYFDLVTLTGGGSEIILIVFFFWI